MASGYNFLLDQVGTPAAPNTSVQFNDGGVFGGDASFTYDKTTDTLTVGKKLLIAAGTVTASSPVMDLSQTWNNAGVSFTGMVLNITDTASQAVSYSMLVQLGGAMRFSVRKDGVVYVHTAVNYNGTNLWSNGNSPYMSNSVGNINQFNSAGGLLSAGNGSFGFSSNATSALVAADVSLFRDAASTLAQRVGTAAQTFRVYNTYTDASNYERGKISWVTNVLQIGTEKAGTGAARALELQTDGTTRLTIGATGSVTVADANNIVVGTTTGTKIGTATTQKLGFYGATPVVQPAAVADATGAGDVVAQLNALLARMRNLGLIAP